jgi:hypothetical protein
MKLQQRLFIQLSIALMTFRSMQPSPINFEGETSAPKKNVSLNNFVIAALRQFELMRKNALQLYQSYHEFSSEINSNLYLGSKPPEGQPDLFFVMSNQGSSACI